MPATRPLSRDLDDEECRHLLGTTPIGRLGFTDRALPMILPAHYTVREPEVVLASLPDSKVNAAARATIVAFETDHYDPGRQEGWCVSLVGPSRLICDPDEVSALDGLDFAPWTGDPRQHYIGIRIAMLRGRRLSRPA